MKTATMIEAAENVRAIYKRDYDKLLTRHSKDTPMLVELMDEIKAIDTLLSRNADFFEYLSGQLVRLLPGIKQ